MKGALQSSEVMIGQSRYVKAFLEERLKHLRWVGKDRSSGNILVLMA